VLRVLASRPPPHVLQRHLGQQRGTAVSVTSAGMWSWQRCRRRWLDRRGQVDSGGAAGGPPRRQLTLRTCRTATLACSPSWRHTLPMARSDSAVGLHRERRGGTCCSTQCWTHPTAADWLHRIGSRLQRAWVSGPAPPAPPRAATAPAATRESPCTPHLRPARAVRARRAEARRTGSAGTCGSCGQS
jgi:hypothetical protein